MNETPAPVFEVNLPVSPYYPWGFHYQVYYIRPRSPGRPFFVRDAQPNELIPCNRDDPARIEPGQFGIYSVETTGPALRGRHKTLASAFSGLFYQALGSLKAGLYDPVYGGLPHEAVEIILDILGMNEKKAMLENPDLLLQTVERLKQAVDAAVARAVREASQAVFGVSAPDPSADAWEAWTPRTIPVPDRAPAPA